MTSKSYIEMTVKALRKSLLKNYKIMLVCRSSRKRCLYWEQITVYDELTRSEKILGEESGIGGAAWRPIGSVTISQPHRHQGKPLSGILVPVLNGQTGQAGHPRDTFPGEFP